MRRTVLRVTGVALVALTVWAALLVGWEIWQQPTSSAAPQTGGDAAGELAQVADVPATNRLVLASGETLQLAALEVPTANEPFAEEGRQAARALVLGQEVRVEGTREAAYVYLPEGELLQTLLVAGGYARVAENAPANEAVTAMRESETAARQANLGLWGAPIGGARLPTLPPSEPVACDPSLVPGESIGPVEAASALGETVTVVLFPTRATTRNGAVTLETGTSADAFGVMIPAGLASTVEEVGARYISRCLLVTGKVERGVEGAPRITIRSFDELQVLR